jgi:hypothetical protein
MAEQFPNKKLPNPLNQLDPLTLSQAECRRFDPDRPLHPASRLQRFARSSSLCEPAAPIRTAATFRAQIAPDSEVIMRRKLIAYCEMCGSDRLTCTADFIVYHRLSFCSPDCQDDYRVADAERRDEAGHPPPRRPDLASTAP